MQITIDAKFTWKKKINLYAFKGIQFIPKVSDLKWMYLFCLFWVVHYLYIIKLKHGNQHAFVDLSSAIFVPFGTKPEHTVIFYWEIQNVNYMGNGVGWEGKTRTKDVMHTFFLAQLVCFNYG
jgi:hypothetical protein